MKVGRGIEVLREGCLCARHGVGSERLAFDGSGGVRRQNRHARRAEEREPNVTAKLKAMA